MELPDGPRVKQIVRSPSAEGQRAKAGRRGRCSNSACEILRCYSETIYFPPVAFAALHTANPAPYRKFLETWMKNGAWKSLYQTVSHNPAHWSGDTAFLFGNMPGCFFWTNWAPYVTSALGTDTVWNPAIAAEFKRVEEEGKPSPTAPLSWQTEFDNHPELSGYLDPQKPWNTAR